VLGTAGRYARRARHRRRAAGALTEGGAFDELARASQPPIERAASPSVSRLRDTRAFVAHAQRCRQFKTHLEKSNIGERPFDSKPLHCVRQRSWRGNSSLDNCARADYISDNTEGLVVMGKLWAKQDWLRARWVRSSQLKLITACSSRCRGRIDARRAGRRAKPGANRSRLAAE